MNFLEERIVKDGIVKSGNVLKVDSFLNHQMDVQLLDEIQQQLYFILWIVCNQIRIHK